MRNYSRMLANPHQCNAVLVGSKFLVGFSFLILTPFRPCVTRSSTPSSASAHGKGLQLRAIEPCSSSDFRCTTFAVCGYIEGGILSYFLRATMSSSFFFISAFMPLASLGSCPIAMMISSKDFILLSFSREEDFSKSN